MTLIALEIFTAGKSLEIFKASTTSSLFSHNDDRK